jgi:hypothetical protein
MVNCGKRGSLLITCVPINVSATEPAAAANATDTNDTAYLMDAPVIEQPRPPRRTRKGAQQYARASRRWSENLILDLAESHADAPGVQPPEHRTVGALGRK